MQNHGIGFIASWGRLTSERGWYKPILLLALLSWVPILGTIALLGYAYEWARLAAWGVDTAPRRQGIDYGKLLATGGWAFLILVTMSIAAGIVAVVFFDVDYSAFLPLDFGASGTWGLAQQGEGYLFSMSVPVTARELVGLAFQVVAGGFILAAMMRGVIYDGFSAGWRLDRLFQMIGRDPGGFMRVVATCIIGCAAGVLYTWLSTAVLGAVMSTGLAMFGWHEGSLYLIFNAGFLLRHLFSLDPIMALSASLFSLGLSFVGSAISVAMQLVATHATGMWFRRFDVERWGLSSDPLPSGVPHDRA